MKVISPLFAVAIAAAVFAPRVDAACPSLPCAVGETGCVVDATVPVGTPLTITAPAAPDCPLGKYLTLKVGAAATDVIAVTFSDGQTSSATDVVKDDPDATIVCSSSYKDVGKDVFALTNVAKAVSATVTCNNPVPVGGGTAPACKVTYLPMWTCQPGTGAVCPKACSDATNCKESTIAISGSLVLTNPDTCPANKYSYLASLVVGASDKTAINVAVAAASVTTAAVKSDSSFGTCYYGYAQYPVLAADLAAQTDDAKVTVTCADAAKACKVQAYSTWGCDAPKCSTVCGAGCTDAVIVAGGNFVLPKPETKCPAGTFVYPKGLTIGGKYAAHNLAVSFNNNLAPKPTAPVADCYFSYPDAVGTSALTSDVEVKVQCKDAAKPCTVQYKVDSWECQAKTYTRTAMTGANCKAANDCANRCGKSYSVNAKSATASFVPLLAADCKCTTLTATMATGGLTASNADMGVKFDSTANTMEIDVTKAGALCKSTYAVSTFTSPFISRSYIRQSMEPAACVKADDSTYKCDGDVTLAHPANDKITLTQATPGPGAITCSGVAEAFVSDDAKTATDATAKIVYTPTTTGMKVVTTNADTTCTAVYAGRCAKPCTGCTDQAIAAGGSYVVKKAEDKTCPTGQFAYPKTLLVGGKDLSQVAVTFNNGLKPTPIDSSGDCFFSYGDVVGSSAVTSNVEATVKCKDPAVACTAQVKVGDWGCYSSVDATKTYMRTTMTGAKCGAVSDCANRCGKSYAVSIKDGTASFLPQLAADCKCATLTATMAADLKTATNADMTATFDAAAKTLAFDVTKAGSECKTTYAVGTFANPFVTRSYIRQSMAPATCVKADDNAYKCDGDLALTQAAIDKITLTQATPGPGAITCTGTTDAFLSDNGNTATDSTTKIVYTPTATGMQVVTTNADSTCTAVYAGRCAKPCVGCTDQAIAVGGSFVVKKAEDKTCPTGQFAYPKTLTVGGKDLSQVAVTFNNGLKPTVSDSLNDCFFSYTDVVGSAAVTSHVEATVKCKDPAVACTAQVKVSDWGCYGPPDAAKTYTRTAMTGANCNAKLSECANRCGKSYALGVKDTLTTYVPQLAPDCNCPQLTATPAADAKSATNTDAGLTVTYDTTAATMSLAYAKTGAVCTSTYKLAAFTNPFPVKTFTRQNVTPADCVAATDCGYRCDAEIALNKTQVDTVAAVRTAVASCTCKTTVTYVGDDRKAVGADDTATYSLESTGAGVTVSTTIGAKTCVAAYTEKIVTPAPTTPAPVTTTPAPTAKTGTGTSAGVSALGAGAGAGVTTVTLVAAAAGVQAIGLPV